MSLIGLYYECTVWIYYNVYRFKKHGANHPRQYNNYNAYLEIIFLLNLIQIEAYTKPNNV